MIFHGLGLVVCGIPFVEEQRGHVVLPHVLIEIRPFMIRSIYIYERWVIPFLSVRVSRNSSPSQVLYTKGVAVF